VPDLDKIDAELDRRRLEAQQRIVQSRRIAKFVVGTILAIVAVLLVVFLGRYSDLFTTKQGFAVIGIVVVLVGLEILALKLNSRRENPWSQAVISALFLVLLFGVLSAVI
jgi:hypothetical protein